MEYNPTINLLSFTDRVRVMNQTRQQEIRLTANDANNLHADITAMLAEIARLSILADTNNQEVVQIAMDGGGFK